MENLFNFIELIGGALASIIAILVFFKMVIFPFFIKLNVQLTKDLFFRLTDLGEFFFPKVIVYAPINIQIIDCVFELKGKKDTQETSYICKAEKFGSVERNSINEHSIASFYLPKRSPEFLLKQGESKELLIQCSINESTKKITQFIAELLDDYIQIISTQPISTQPNKKSLNEKVDKHSANILSSIKVESGDHKLICKITYKYRHSFITWKKSIESEIKINITEKTLDIYKNQQSIKTFLFDCLSGLDPKNQNIKIRYPECTIN